MTKIYDRRTGLYYEEQPYGSKSLHFLYHTLPGKLLLKAVTCKIFSKLVGRYYDHRLSRRMIEPFIRKYQIDRGDFEEKSYDSFNDFFTRKYKQGKRIVSLRQEEVIAPADAKLLVVPISKHRQIEVKGCSYTVESLLQDGELAVRYQGGYCLIYRLTVDDYHRYCYVESGPILREKRIDGKLHTVSDLSAGHKIYMENQREYQWIESATLGKVVQMEVGALLVGKIVNTPNDQAVRGQEKGYFSFGGSTIIVLVEKDSMKIDPDIIKHSEQTIETKVRYGERVGRIYDKQTT